MQAKPQEVSGDKATTPATELRLVSVEQLQKIHRELDACQKVIWLAGCGNVGYGFDPAYVTSAQEQLRVIDDVIAAQPRWTKTKPATPGAYWVRGFRLGEHDCRPALVEVARNEAGTLLCNMHDSNTNDDLREWSFVEDLAERFEWSGPLSMSEADNQFPHCDFCGVVPDHHPWHGSGVLKGVESRHIHACNECRSQLPSTQQAEPFMFAQLHAGAVMDWTQDPNLAEYWAEEGHTVAKLYSVQGGAQ